MKDMTSTEPQQLRSRSSHYRLLAMAMENATGQPFDEWFTHQRTVELLSRDHIAELAFDYCGVSVTGAALRNYFPEHTATLKELRRQQREALRRELAKSA